MRRAAKIDKAQPAIVEGLRKHGIVVEMMPQPGDILCYGNWFPHSDTRVWIPMEVKSSQAVRGYKPELTDAQKRRLERGMPIPIVHNLAEALALFGIED